MVRSKALLLLALGSAAAVDPCYTKDCIGEAQKTQLTRRPHLLPYNPVALSGATVLASDTMARFTVLTDRLIRMEYALVAGKFEDRASLAVLHRALSPPKFQVSRAFTLRGFALAIRSQNRNPCAAR